MSPLVDTSNEMYSSGGPESKASDGLRYCCLRIVLNPEQHSSGATLSGWTGIEHHMAKHDTGMVKDYADDIDTLLVFVSILNLSHHISF